MSFPVKWREEPISRSHDRASFDCGDEDLNRYLKQYARQNHDNGAAKTFVAVSDMTRASILGFYSLSPASIDFDRTPEKIRQGLARYDVPAYRLGRLAVDRSMQRQGLGGSLIFAAGRRCLRIANEIGGIALVIDAKNERVASWYESYGALPLLDTPLTLMISLQTLRASIRSADPETR